MFHRPISTPAIKYSVLQPNPQITQIKRNFSIYQQFSEYELAINEETGIRRYRLTVEQIEKLLASCQWRMQQKSPIVRCHYVQLLRGIEYKKIPVEVYLDHLEITVAQLKKMLLPQAIYMIKRAFQGYKALMNQFSQVTVNEQTIGLDRTGNCLVWLNRSLSNNYSEECKMNCPNKIMKQIVYLVKSKSEPVCYGHLSKLLDNLEKKLTFDEGFQTLQLFSKNYKIILPSNLKYIVNQYRLDQKMREINLRYDIYESRANLFAWKTPNFVTSRRNLIQDINSPHRIDNMKKKAKLFSTLRKTTSPPLHFLTYRSKNMKAINSDAIHNSNQSQNLKFKHSSTNRRKNLSHRSRSRSDYLEGIQIVKNVRPKTQKNFVITRSIEHTIRDKKSSGFSGNANTAESLTSIQSIKKITCFSNERMTKRTIENLSNGQQFQSIECSPFIIREENSKEKHFSKNNTSLEQSQNLFAKDSEIIRANNWTKTLNKLLEAEIDLNTSVTIGRDIKKQKVDSRLEKLNFVQKQLAQSIND